MKIAHQIQKVNTQIPPNAILVLGVPSPTKEVLSVLNAMLVMPVLVIMGVVMPVVRGNTVRVK